MGPRWRYIANEVGIGLRRNTLMSVATVITLMVSLTLLGAGLLIRTQVVKTQNNLYSQLDLSIFLSDDMSEGQRTSLEADLNANALVEEVLYVSKQQAYADAQELFEDNQTLIESIGPNDLPASYRVKLSDPEQTSVVRSQFVNYPGVDEIPDDRDTLDRFFFIMRKIEEGAYGIALMQGIAAIALVFNTIRITAFARREQTGIMKLVGATNWYVRLPFMLEGIFAGLLGALFSSALLVAAKTFFLDGVSDQLALLSSITYGDLLRILPVLFLVGVVLSALASFLSLRRFLAV